MSISNAIKDLIILLEKKFELDTTPEGGSPNVDLKTKFGRFIQGTKEAINRADDEIKPMHLLKAVGIDVANIVGYQMPLSPIDIATNIYKDRKGNIKEKPKHTIKGIAVDTMKNMVPGYNTGHLFYKTGQDGLKTTFNTNRAAKVNTYLAQRAQRAQRAIKLK